MGLVLRARFIWILATQPAPISRSDLQSKCPSPSRPHGAMNLGATLTHVTVMHLTAQRVTTSLVHSSTALPHAAPRTHTQRWRAQPTPWAMLNAHRPRMRQPVMPILSRWALAWRSLGWVPMSSNRLVVERNLKCHFVLRVSVEPVDLSTMLQ